RKFFSTIYNTYSFFALYANVDGFDPNAPQIPVSERPEIDRWIISLLNTLVRNVDEALNDYEPTRAAREINDFVTDNLSNWYVRLNRKRFWGKEMDSDKLSAYQTLYTCLRTVSLLIAPFAPFFAHRLYDDLTQGTTASVHLADFPVADASVIDRPLEERMRLAQTITSMVLSLRRKADLKVRQPLQKIMVPADEERREALLSMQNLILAEVNVKELDIVTVDSGLLVKRVKPDFKKLGPKFGKRMKQVAAAIAALDQPSIARLESEGRIELIIDGESLQIDASDVDIFSQDIPGWLVANEGTVTVALDITLTDELRNEGLAREIVNRVQNIRKSRGYEITDNIILTFAPSEAIDKVVSQFGTYISTQVLASAILVEPLADGNADVETLDIDSLKVQVAVTLA
ncbi:MAG: class I tRNA ligase family protein, partial [Muribaculaceae bacterium]|nr:class I tRNA ligase family protein [Muribaculaceae bacterium]